MISKYRINWENYSSLDGVFWGLAWGRLIKDRVYDASYMPKSIINTSSSHCYSVESLYPI